MRPAIAKTDDLSAPIFWWLFAAILLIRLLGLAFAGFPVGPDEGQYWAYGQEMAFGHYSKPPLLGWVITLGEFVFGHNDVGLRIGVLLIHGLIALILMQVARELSLKGSRWAALCYFTLPAVAYSSNIASTDPPMMLGWALALWGITRARQHERQGFVLAGLGLGLAVLGKYTGFVIFALFVLGAFLPQTRARFWPHMLWMILVAGVIMAPNLYWNWAHDFASFRHVGDNANLDGPLMNPGKMAEFVLAQFGIFGPLMMALLIPASIHALRDQPQGGLRLLLIWVWPLLLLMITQSLLSRAHANWAAPVYVAASLLVVVYVVHKNWLWVLKISVGLGILATIILPIGNLVVAAKHQDWQAKYDIGKRFRFADQLAKDLTQRLGKEDILLVDDRKLHSLMLYRLSHDIKQSRALVPGNPSSHYQLAYPYEGAAGCYLFISRNGVPKILEKELQTAKMFIREVITYQTHQDRSYNIDVIRFAKNGATCR